MRSWLVVEDEPSIYDVLHSMFQMWGVEGIACNDGEQAFALIDDIDSGRYRGQLPEMAVVDIRMPGKLDGIDVGRRIRQSPLLGPIAVVLISAFVLRDSDQQEAIARSGADTLIVKPLPRPSEFRRQLEAVIAARKATMRDQTPASHAPTEPVTPPPVVTPAMPVPPTAPVAAPPAEADAADKPAEKRPERPTPAITPRRRISAPRPPVLPELDDDEMTTREQTQDMPRLRQAESDTQPAANAGMTPPRPADDE